MYIILVILDSVNSFYINIAIYLTPPSSVVFSIYAAFSAASLIPAMKQPLGILNKNMR